MRSVAVIQGLRYARSIFFERGDPFLKHRNPVTDQAGNEDPNLVFGHKRCGHPLAFRDAQSLADVRFAPDWLGKLYQ
jgi:hypothetical protein